MKNLPIENPSNPPNIEPTPPTTAANNLAVVRHIVMNLLRLNTTRKASIKSKRMLAATIDEFRAELLGVMT